jgi:uncharacterized membrane-anchored protein
MKRMQRLLGILFGFICAVQLGVIGWSIWSYERILKEGEVYFFNVLPLDPYDAFRGRYVTLRFENANKAPAGDTTPQEHLSKAYAMLEHTQEGDRIKEVRFSKPVSGNFLEVNVYSAMATQKADVSNTVYFSLPFDRFYLREDRAPKAERILRMRDVNVNVKASLRVLNGKAVIENLWIEGVPLVEWMRRHEEARSR